MNINAAIAFLKDPRNKMRLEKKDKQTSDKFLALLNEILYLTFKSDTEIESIAAFTFIQIENPFIIEALSLSKFFTELFDKFPISDCLACRFCTLIENIITYFPKNTNVSIPFFNDLVNYCYQYPIQKSLEKILGARMRFRVFHAILRGDGFVDRLIDELKNEKNRENVFGLMNLVVQNTIFESDSKTLEFIETISEITDDNTNQWKLLSNVVNEDNIDILSKLIPEAISVVHRIDDYFYEFKIHALNFILASITIDPSVIMGIEPLVLASLITDILEKEFDNSNALQVAETGVFILAKEKYTRKSVAKHVVPLIKQLAYNYKSVTQRSFIMDILLTTMKNKERNPEIYELFKLDEDILKLVEDWNNLLISPYGICYTPNQDVMNSPPIYLELEQIQPVC